MTPGDREGDQGLRFEGFFRFGWDGTVLHGTGLYGTGTGTGTGARASRHSLMFLRRSIRLGIGLGKGGRRGEQSRAEWRGENDGWVDGKHWIARPIFSVYF